MRKHTKNNGNEPSQRQLRVGEQIRHIISQTLQRGHFRNETLLDMANTITVSEVRASPDLKHARVYVMTLGGESMEDILPALNDESHVFQKEIARQANLKFTPKVKFVTDDSFANAERIENLLRDVRITADHGEDSDESTEEA